LVSVSFWFLFIDIFWLFTYLYAKYKPFILGKKCCTTEKTWCHITLLPPYQRHLFPHGGCSGEVRLLFHQKSLNKSTIASKMASIMVAHAQGCDVILKKSGRLYQILMSYLGKITEQIAICSPANNSHNISIMGY